MPQTQPKCLKAQREAIEHEHMSSWPRKVHRISLAKPYPVSTHPCLFSKPIVVGLRAIFPVIFTLMCLSGLQAWTCSTIANLSADRKKRSSDSFSLTSTLHCQSDLSQGFRETTDLPLSPCQAQVQNPPVPEPTPYGLATKNESSAHGVYCYSPYLQNSSYVAPQSLFCIYRSCLPGGNGVKRWFCKAFDSFVSLYACFISNRDGQLWRHVRIRFKEVVAVYSFLRLLTFLKPFIFCICMCFSNMLKYGFSKLHVHSF